MQGEQANEAAHLTQFSLPSHVHVCALPGGAILLDLKSDRYLGLDSLQTHLLQGALNGWPAASDHRGASQTEKDWRDLCANLVNTGLLLPDASGTAWRQPNVDMNQSLISLGDEYETEAALCPQDVMRFACAFAATRWALRYRPLWQIVQRMQARKQRGSSAPLLDLSHLTTLVSIFRRLRPWAFTAENRCLLHALTLLEFLNRNEVYPDWVIGVALQPWAAHSWVQQGPYLFDTNPEKVCRFKPILVV